MDKADKEQLGSVRTGPAPLPQAFVERLQRQFSQATVAAILAGFAAVRPTFFRVNTLLATEEDCIASLREAGLTPQRLAWLDTCRQVETSERRRLTDSDAFARGHIYIQNPASMLAPLVLSPQPGEKVLDLCATPGSKTVQLAGMIENHGWISAVEPVRERYHRLAANVRKHGVIIAHLYQRDGTHVWKFVPEEFDRVLVDAPCSSEGQFQLANPDSYRFWHRKKSREMAVKQKKLLFSGINCLKPGGTLLYSTCTLAAEENEEVLDTLLAHFAGAVETLPLDLPCPSLPPLAAWNGNRFGVGVGNARRLLPGEITESFFLCLLRKTASTTGRRSL